MWNSRPLWPLCFNSSKGSGVAQKAACQVPSRLGHHSQLVVSLILFLAFICHMDSHVMFTTIL